MLLNSTVFYGMCVKEIKQPGSEGQIQMASVFILKMRILRQKEEECRLVFSAQHNNVGNVKVRPTKGRETVSGSIFLDTGPRGYGLRLRTSREEDEMTISNTLTVRSGDSGLPRLLEDGALH